ncbi:sperm flagellar protein 2-like isoform X1 [Mytilus trossulus]|uniref:sperm flagellar protein 2-like isoform X1 n=1 Tax=Mytilus trossulus TaxID=6551 RepID=UPI003006DE9C
MTDILCGWLNDELTLSQKVEQATFSRDFASGFLIGEVLQKNGLQDDFDQFSQSKTSDSKLNNFTRIEPVLHLLGIPFDTNVARDIMTEKHGTATRLMYQLYIALQNKKKANLTGVAMETMRPAAPAKLNAVESGIYKERLKHATPRQTDLNLNEVITRFHDKQIEMEKTAFKERFLEQERIREQQQDHRQKLLERSKFMRDKQSEIVAKIQAATVHIPKPPPQTTAKAIQRKRDIKKKREAEETVDAISQFEDKMKMILPQTEDSDDIDMKYIMSRGDEENMMDQVELIKPASNDDYIGKIRKRLQEDASARAEREKRRRKVLVDQMKAHAGQEDARREEMLVNRLMRQSQQERRIAVQLLQARHEKEVIKKNRITRELQYEQARLKDFENALNREAELARLAKEEYAEQTQKDQELHDKIAAERAEDRYHKHYEMCDEVVNQICDFSCKVAEYRELTNQLLPPKLMRDWKVLFTEGKPLFEPPQPIESTEPTPEQILEQERQNLLDETDFMEYKNMVGEWQPPEGGEISKPPRDNPIVGHIIQRLFNMVHPPTPPPPPPEFPPFPIRACILGKVFSGKSSVLKKLTQERRVEILCVDDLVNGALEAHKNGETMPQIEPEATIEPVPAVETVDDTTVTTTDPVPAPETAPVATTEEGEQKQETKKTKKGKDPSKPAQKDSEPEPTPKAKLGAKAQKYLKRGAPIDDQVIVDIIVEAIRNIPEGTGWILDGFPSNYNQAKVLEKALTGFGAADSKDKQKSKKSNLVPDPRPAPPPADPASGIDVVIKFEISDELCLKRAAGRYHTVQGDEEFHQEFKPPPDGSATGVGKQEQVIPVADQAHDQEQIQHRITGFLDAWPKLEKWYAKFGTLKVVDATQEEKTVYLEVDRVLEDTLDKLLGRNQPEISETADIPPVEEKKEVPPPEPETPKEEPEVKSRSPSGSRKGSGKKGSRPGSSRSKSPKDKDKKRDKSGSPKRGSGKKSDTGSAKKSSRMGSPKGKKGSGKKKTPEPEPEPEPQEPTGPPPPEPGSEEWSFVDLPLQETLAEILSKYWEDIEKEYVTNSKYVFRKVRDERENIYRYFYQIRKDYMAYLRRPDNKQVYISQWQKEYNEIPDDMREDEETKAELHQRVDDLTEALWSISDERKVQAENERQNIVNDGWLDDRLGVLSNFYITTMQAEVDRYQDTVRLMKDYYRGMDGQIPDELNATYARLPLIELPVERPPPPEIPASETGSAPPSRPKSGESSRSQSPKSPKGSRSSSAKKRSQSPKERKSRTPSAKKRDKSKEKKPVEEQPIAEEGDKKRIPLVPRRPVSPDADAKAGAAAAASKKDKKGGKKDDAGAAESPQPPMDPDERLIFDAFQTATGTLSSILQNEQAAREQEEEAERKREEEREREKAAATAAATKKGGKADKGKKGKSRSPSPKKKKEGEATPTPVSESESEEDREKKEKKNRMKEEYYFAIQEEETACKTRLELIKLHACGVLQDLKNKADNAYKDMNDWLGARFLKENESVDHMSEVMRNAVEEKKPLKQELVIKQEDFLLNDDLKVLKTPCPATPPPLEEEPKADMFTVKQLYQLFKQFQETAPTGVLSKQSFIETFETMVGVAFGMEQLPDHWMNINPVQVQELANALSSDGEYVDWRRCLLSISLPIPIPTQSDLLATLQKFKEMDQKSTGFVTREQYDRMDLWFGSMADGTGFNRLVHLKAELFDFFADHTKTPVVMDYISMLMYFSAHSYSHEGFLRALSVSCGHHMPRLGKLDPRPPSVSESNLDSLDDPSPPPAADDIPVDAVDAQVPLDSLYRVLHHGESAKGDSHRFSVSADPEDATSREKLAGVYQELGSEETESLPWKILVEHPLIQDIVQACHTFKSVDVKAILNSPNAEMDLHSTKTLD